MHRVPCTVCRVPGVVCRVPCVVCRESQFLLSSFTVTVHGACEYKVATQFACLSAYSTGRENERSVGRAPAPLRPCVPAHLRPGGPAGKRAGTDGEV